jgi:anti-sigma factor ChrR (cupin superfamily)
MTTETKPLAFDLSPFVRFSLDDAALAKLPWKDFGNGTAIAKLARDGERGIVAYRIAKDAPDTAFQPHTHPGGETYLVLRGAITDESGTYPAGSVLWLDRASRHTPRGSRDADTVIIVVWPEGIKVG